MLQVVYLSIMAPNTFSTHYNDQISDPLPGLLDQYLFTLWWASFSESTRERLAFSVAYKCSLCNISVWYQLVAMQINHNARPNIVDTPLKIIFRMGHGACWFLFSFLMRPITHSWMSASNHQVEYPRSKTKNHWHGMDCHFRNGAGSIPLLFLIVKVANTSEMDNDVP